MTREIVIRIQVPDGMDVPEVDYQDAEPPHPAARSEQTPSGAGAQCKHGRMIHKSGTSKAGKDYDGYFCPEDSCKPVWA